MRNPVTTKKHYRLYVIHKLPNVRLIDFQKVKLKVWYILSFYTRQMDTYTFLVAKQSFVLLLIVCILVHQWLSLLIKFMRNKMSCNYNNALC